MITIKEYTKVGSLEEAYQLNQSRKNTVLGGMLWLKMGKQNIRTAIDLSGLEMNRIEEDEEKFSIGAMCSLRTIELHSGLNELFDGAVRESLRHIVGVQFRNCATIGGSIFGRFGFSDILTCLLALDSYVELYSRGTIPLKEFINLPRDNDILVRIIIKKSARKVIYQSFRRSYTDFPMLTSAVSKAGDRLIVSIGARPMKAAVLELGHIDWEEIQTEQKLKNFAGKTAGRFSYGSNMRGSLEYREHLAAVSINRALKRLEGVKL